MPDPLVTFIHISDTHIHHDPHHTRDFADYPPNRGAEALVKTLNELPYRIDFVLHTGDVVYDPVPKMYYSARDILNQLKYPIHYLAGNHDAPGSLQNTLIQQGDTSLQVHYTFEVNGVQFVCVDSNGPAKAPAGYITDTQLSWLQEICTSDDPRPLVIATHHNVLPAGIPWWDDYMGMKNGNAFHDAILPAKHRLRGVFFGHVHQHIDLYKDGILYASTASSWTQLNVYPTLQKTVSEQGARPGYSLVIIYPDQTLIRRCQFSVPEPFVDPDTTEPTR